MKTVFIKKIGIHPWDQTHHSDDEQFVTITLLNQDYASVWKTWCEFSSSLAQHWPKIVQWHTKLAPYFNKSQEHLSLKNFAKTSTPGDILKKHELTDIYSQVTLLNPDPFKIDPTRMAVYRTCITLMQKQNSENENTWRRLSNLDCISTIDDIKLVLADNLSISFRFYDAETHGTAQLICHSEHLSILSDIIQKMDINEIQQKDIYTYIHS
ncbi:hypothetical protein PS687_04277 [Pseudomonas fluorescens]|nr:hypothetical protein PS687_04277 [Pseudomonas fluorescens]